MTTEHPTTVESLPPLPRRRVKAPTVLQMEAVECGAAALASVLACHGRYESLDTLRRECSVTRDGVRAAEIVRAARRYGLEARGLNLKQFPELIETLGDEPLPAILWWNVNHFVVLEGFRKGRAEINDPAIGPRTLTLDELKGAYSGVVLLFKPGPDFEPGGQKRSLRQGLIARAAGLKGALAYVFLCGLFLVVPGLLVPTSLRIFVDEYLVAGRDYLVLPLLGGMVLAAFLRAILTWLQEYYLLRLETRLAVARSRQFFAHVLRLPVGYFLQRLSGEVGSRVMINDTVASVLGSQLTTTVLDGALALFYLAVMFAYAPQLSLVVLALGLANVLALKLVSRRRVDAAYRLRQEHSKLMGTAANGLSMIETLKATGAESEFFSRWAGYQAKVLRAEQSLGTLDQMVAAVPPTVQTAATAAVVFLGGREVMAGNLSIGMLVACQSLAMSFLRPVQGLAEFGSTVQKLGADMSRLDDVLDNPRDARYLRRSAPVSRHGRRLSGRIEVRDLTFGYGPRGRRANPLIQDFSLTVEPGQRIALVGASGSGKSTIVRLIAGLYEPWEGEILFDGERRQELPNELVSDCLAFVDQDIFLFGGNVRDNVALWNETTPLGEITRACKDARIDGDVAQRPGGYETVVAEHGANFSGGQRQRLEIARALLNRPTLLLFDEATSALDPKTEQEIDDSIRRLGCSSILVAHRLSTIRDCDEIIVLERGKIKERGSHEALLRQRGEYARLIEN